MIRKLAALSLFAAAATLQAATPQIFPDDYKPTDCPIPSLCASWKATELASAGARMQGYTHMKQQWIDEHWDQLMTDMKPYCAKLGACYATAGNTNMFCNDVVLTQAMTICDQFKQKDDHDQCFLILRTWVSGIDLTSWKAWEEAKACIAANPPKSQELRQFELTMTPKTIPPDFDGKIVIYALDKETHIPVKSSIQVGDEILYSKDVPDGTPTTSYALPWTAKLTRVKSANGHEELVAPMVTIQRDGYETVKFRMPVDIRPMDVTITPSVSSLKRGKNTVTVTAKDPSTGKPVDARVIIGDRDTADAGQPFELDIAKKGQRPEIWVRSSFDRYNDTVVAPAAN